jgi:DNA-directed RNA polymerase specialized sigma subunit
VNHNQECGNNTKYFHLITNGKHKKKRIFQLDQDEEKIVGQENLKSYITQQYKKLFGAPELCEFILREDVIHDIPQLSEEEKDILTLDFTEEEVWEAISQMSIIKHPCQMGFPRSFTKKKLGGH